MLVPNLEIFLCRPSLRQPNEEFNLTGVGEPIIVRVQLRNPSALRLRLTALRLDCVFQSLVSVYQV